MNKKLEELIKERDKTKNIAFTALWIFMASCVFDFFSALKLAYLAEGAAAANALIICASTLALSLTSTIVFFHTFINKSKKIDELELTIDNIKKDETKKQKETLISENFKKRLESLTEEEKTMIKELLVDEGYTVHKESEFQHSQEENISEENAETLTEENAKAYTRKRVKRNK